MDARRNASGVGLIKWRSALMQDSLLIRVAIFVACAVSVSAVKSPDRERMPGEPLVCYTCSSRASPNATVCENGTLTQMTPANTTWQSQCSTEHTSCMVQVYKTSITGNSSATIVERIWSVERQCAEDCDPGCLTVGERTKIIKCVSCCEEDLCNYTDGAATLRRIEQALLWVALAQSLVVK